PRSAPPRRGPRAPPPAPRRGPAPAREAARPPAVRRPPRQHPRVPSPRPRARAACARRRHAGQADRLRPMTDLLLFRDIDEPGLATLAVYERRGGYRALRKALAMSHEDVLHELQLS